MHSRQQIIANLQKQAAEVLSLKNQHRQKRPIVIEFSGSPKSGKTSCINSLELFLKRNGFSVRTIQERASVCPVLDKMSPMFNIWTSCTSLAGMIGTLEATEKAIDVLILDRGIFDALCWFNWLVNKGRMEKGQQEIMEAFLLMEELVKPIDIVFAFSVDPSRSIEREYTNLLTDKLGTIMNEQTLTEYRDSVRKMCDMKKEYFHKIIPIDTTDLNQNEVGKHVTEMTLQTLKELLMEKIGFFRRCEQLRNVLSEKPLLAYPDIAELVPDVDFDLRADVEDADEFIQPIPVAILTNSKRNSVLIVKKNNKAVSTASAEKDRLLAYVGGHIRFEDTTEITAKDFLTICRRTLKREIKEELGISVALDGIEPFVVYTTDRYKSKKHLAICFVVEIDENIKLHIDSEELVQKRGRSKSGSFMTLKEIQENIEDFESWSRIILYKKFGLFCNLNFQTTFEQTDF